MAKGIQVGANTHHHDQVITFVNFNATKSSVSNVPKPTPELLDFAIAVALMINNKKFTVVRPQGLKPWTY